jgi:hypothetical protein
VKPETQAVQAPPLQYWPGAQLMAEQTRLDVGVQAVDSKKPAAQADVQVAQDEAPAADHVPAEQTSGCVEPAGQEAPAGHVEQVPAPFLK